MSWAPNQHIRMISEKNAEHSADNSAVITRISYIWKYIKKKTVILHCKYRKFDISQYYCIFDQINTAFGRKKRLSKTKKKKKVLQTPNL